MSAFITINNGVVTGYFCGDIGTDLTAAGYGDHEKIGLPDELVPPREGEPATYYNPDWTRKSDEELVSEGLLKLPSRKEYILNGVWGWTDFDLPVGAVQYTPDEWYMDGESYKRKTPEYLAEQEKRRSISELENKIAQLETRQARPIREIEIARLTGAEAAFAAEKLQQLEAEIAAARTELARLS